MKSSLFLLVVCVAALLAGCSTVVSRSQEKAAVFSTLDPETQTRLEQKVVRVGDSPDMVYIALGHPDRVRETTTPTARVQTWIYTATWHEYEGPVFPGYLHPLYRGGYARRMCPEPFEPDLYSDHEEEYLRIAFQDGKVTAIEQAKR